MREYTKVIILSSVLLVLIALITLSMIFDVDLVLFKNLSISGIQEKKMNVEKLIIDNALEQVNNMSAKGELQESKNAFDVAKQAYENIDESTIEIVQEATKEEKYFIEYLWIVLGNYATNNNVAINILTPGATNVTNSDSSTNDTGASGVDDEGDFGLGGSSASNSTFNDSGVQITIKGRYANIADFVFDVENDKSLRFKLDNIRMAYSGDNKIQATFDVLSLSVLK